MSSFWSRRPRPARTGRDYWWARRRRRQRTIIDDTGLPVSIEMLTRDELYNWFQEMRHVAGRGSGIDHVTFDDLSNSEVGALVGELARHIQRGTYVPQPTRSQNVPKPGGKGVRRLQIPVLLDRLVQKCLKELLEPLWEKVFLPCSWGFRPNRNTWGMLCTLERVIAVTGRQVLAIEDLKNAFENVPIQETIECHRKMLIAVPAPELPSQLSRRRQANIDRVLTLVATVLRGADPARQRGIDQGNNYSPTALNALMHYWLDEPLSNTMRLPLWHRFADNFCHVCQSVGEGEEVLANIRHRLTPLRMTLKGEDGVTDLAKGGEVQLLGFSIRCQDRELIYGPGKQARGQLRQSLEQAHKSYDPSSAALAVVKGWIDSCGPTFESGSAVIPMILSDAADLGFRELTTPDEIVVWCQESWNRWLQYRCRYEHHQRMG